MIRSVSTATIHPFRLWQLRQAATRQLVQPVALAAGSGAPQTAAGGLTQAESSERQRKKREHKAERSSDSGESAGAAAAARAPPAANKQQQRRPRSGHQKTDKALNQRQQAGAQAEGAQRQRPKPEAAVQLEQLQRERQRRQQQQRQAKQQAKPQRQQQGQQQQQKGQQQSTQQDESQRASAGRKRWLRRRWRARQKAQEQGQQLADEQPPQSDNPRGTADGPQEESKSHTKQSGLQQQHQERQEQERQRSRAVPDLGAGSTALPAGTPGVSEQPQSVPGASADSQAAAAAAAAVAELAGNHSQQAQQQQQAVPEVAVGKAAAQVLTDPQAERQQAQAVLRHRLEQLHQRQQGQQAGSAAKAAANASVSERTAVAGAGAAVAAPAPAADASVGPAGQQAQQAQHAQQSQQPCWNIDAAEVLCSLGMAPEEAAKALLAAYGYAQRRQRAAADRSSVGQPPAGGAAAGGAAPAAATDTTPHAASAPVTAGQVDSVCRVLVDVAKVPVGRLREVLLRTPQLLGCSAEELRKQHEVLAPVWRRPRRLAQAILKFPAMLVPEYPAQLGTGLKMLGSLGFGREQVSAAILRHPQVVQYKRQDIVRRLRSAGLDLSTAPAEVFKFLAEHPRLLGREGSQQLREKLLLLQGWRLPPPLCPLVLARCPPLLRQSEESLQEAAAILMNYGMTWQQLHAVLLAYPYVLCLQPDLIRLPLKLLADFEISLDRVVEYPRVFGHDPVSYLGPRLAYLKAYNPDKLQYRMVTLLSRSDEEFATKLSGRMAEEYQVFKDAWVRQFEEQVDLPTRSGQRIHALSQRLWAAEVTDELWL
ncbi:hypothetical protein ABPG75_005457 [Micractinium tetrahymenae]